MVTNIIILSILGIIIAIAFFNKEVFSYKLKGSSYMEKLAKYLDVELERPAGENHVWRVSFDVKNHDFTYEHKQEPGLEDSIPARGYLKALTTDSLSLRFSEMTRSTLRINVASLEEIAKNPWGSDSEKVPLPKVLQEFELTTNHPQKAKRLLEDEQIVRLLTKFKNRDNRGKPVMSLEVVRGEIVIFFNPVGGVSPNVVEVQTNPPMVEEYAERLIPLIEKINQISKEIRT